MSKKKKIGYNFRRKRKSKKENEFEVSKDDDINYLLTNLHLS